MTAENEYSTSKVYRHFLQTAFRVPAKNLGAIWTQSVFIPSFFFKVFQTEYWRGFSKLYSQVLKSSDRAR